MNLVPIEYKLENYELPEHRFISGVLYIEIDKTDELPYVWGFDLSMRNEITGLSATYSFNAGQRSKDYGSFEIQQFLHRDKKLMDDIFDDCAREGMWS